MVGQWVSLRKSAARFRNRIYTVHEKSLALLRPGPRLRILFSGYLEYEPAIRGGFNRLPHAVRFGAISAESFSQVDLVVPFFSSELLQIDKWSTSPVRSPIPFPSEECISLCDDKCRLNQMLINTGFERHVPRTGSGIEPPYILKKRHSVWGKESRLIRDRSDEWRVLAQLSDPEFYRQEIIPGRREFATHILFTEHKIVKSLTIMHEFENDTSILGQQLPLYHVIHRCPYLDLFAEILRRIGFQGLCCIDYKVVQGRPYVFEINPRFGGSLAPYFFSFIRHLNSDS